MSIEDRDELRRVLDDIATLAGRAIGRSAAEMDAELANIHDKAARTIRGESAIKPLSEDRVDSLFGARSKMPTVGERDPWYWYAWGVEDCEVAHGIRDAAKLRA